MILHPRHDRHSLTSLRALAATARGRRLLRTLLEDYRAKRPMMSEADRKPHDIAAARVRFALAEQRRPGGAPTNDGHRSGVRAA